MPQRTPEEKKEYMKQWRAANKERISAYQKQYNEENKQHRQVQRAEYRELNREALCEDSKRRYWEDPEKGREKAKKIREADPEAHRARSAAWRAENPEKQKAAVQSWIERNPHANIHHRNLRRARKVNGAGVVSKNIVAKLLEAQNWKCVYCASCLRKAKHLDHKMPLSRGGKHEDANLQMTCPKCNLSKHDKTDEEFRACLS